MLAPASGGACSLTFCKKMKTILPILFYALVVSSYAAESPAARTDKLLQDAPIGFLHFSIDSTDHVTNEFYLKTDKILAVRVAAAKAEDSKGSTVEIYTIAPGMEYSPQGEGKFLPSNQRFLLQFPSVEEARKAVTAILSAITKAEQAASSNR
jgi:hypothetical protein